MCHGWWQQRWTEEREESRRMWEEFDRMRPLNDPQVEDPEVTEVRLEEEEPAPVSTD